MKQISVNNWINTDLTPFQSPQIHFKFHNQKPLKMYYIKNNNKIWRRKKKSNSNF